MTAFGPGSGSLGVRRNVPSQTLPARDTALSIRRAEFARRDHDLPAGRAAGGRSHTRWSL